MNESDHTVNTDKPTSDLRPQTPGTPVIVCAADNGYAMPLAVMLRSLGDNARSVEQVVVHILDGGLTRRNRQRVVRSVAGTPLVLHWLRPDPQALTGMPVFGHVSVCTYYRLLIPTLLPETLQRLIYLDVDTLVTGDIGELWRISLDGHALLAVVDGVRTIGNTRNAATFFAHVSDAESKPYFNAGVVVMDLDKWRRERVVDRALAHLAAHKDQVVFWDQDGLNAVLYDDWKAIPEQWNMRGSIPVMTWSEPDKRDPAVSADWWQFKGIIHFLHWCKPWTFGVKYPAYEVYYHYLDRTVWRGWRPSRPRPERLGIWVTRRLLNKHTYGAMLRRVPGVGRWWAGRRTEVGDQRSEVGGRRSGDGGQRSEV